MQQKLKYKKSELVDIIQKNRTKHADEYTKARGGYQSKLVEFLENALAKAKKGGSITRVPFSPPKKYLDDYDRALKQLEMCVEDEIELNDQEFAQLVMDEWAWKREFTMSNMAYLEDDE